jgi:hypothetical protein
MKLMIMMMVVNAKVLCFTLADVRTRAWFLKQNMPSPGFQGEVIIWKV